LLGGDSAGGTLAIVTAMALRGEVPVAGDLERAFAALTALLARTPSVSL
jgi:acetyl esterase/lipase